MLLTLALTLCPAQVTSNDVMAVWRVLGVEAARATLVREVRAVFGAYGIAVDPRHLGLIADYMMHQVGHARYGALLCTRVRSACSAHASGALSHM